MSEHRSRIPARSASATGDTRRIGRFVMSAECAGPVRGAKQRWSRRAEALAGWLLAEWWRERRETG